MKNIFKFGLLFLACGIQGYTFEDQLEEMIEAGHEDLVYQLLNQNPLPTVQKPARPQQQKPQTKVTTPPVTSTATQTNPQSSPVVEPTIDSTDSQTTLTLLTIDSELILLDSIYSDSIIDSTDSQTTLSDSGDLIIIDSDDLIEIDSISTDSTFADEVYGTLDSEIISS